MTGLETKYGEEEINEGEETKLTNEGNEIIETKETNKTKEMGQNLEVINLIILTLSLIL